MVGGSPGGDGDGGGGRVHRNRYLRVKAVFAGSVNFPANTAFAAMAAIPAAAVEGGVGGVDGGRIPRR